MSTLNSVNLKIVIPACVTRQIKRLMKKKEIGYMQSTNGTDQILI